MDMNVFKGSDKYVVTRELMNAVNVSIALKKPLVHNKKLRKKN